MTYKANLYLIPNLIGDTEPELVLPSGLYSLIKHIKHFIVEDIRTARRFLKKLDKEIVIDDLTFYELNKHSEPTEIDKYLAVAELGSDVGLLSEAGLPCIADPGNVIVMLAHKKNIRVVPISGPSSLFMALMASGLNGQNFAFNGYIPVEALLRINKLKLLENRSVRESQSQIFMDTPYRNDKLLDDILSNLNPRTYLCIASNISCEDEMIATKTIADWKQNKPALNKKPCIFII
jgi:16S rRNA (cytidine1402-2'-O)-methyltransferase